MTQWEGEPMSDDLPKTSYFERELRHLINRHSKENGSNTPDFLLAVFLVGCLDAFNAATIERDRWYNSASVAQKPSEGGTDK